MKRDTFTFRGIPQRPIRPVNTTRPNGAAFRDVFKVASPQARKATNFQLLQFSKRK